MLGVHPIWSGSSTQTIISLSSGEAEFYGAVKAACRTLGLKSLLSDLGFEWPADLVTDSTACKGMASRRGAGKVRHIHCPALWLHQVVSRRGLTIVKKSGKILSPDVGTKVGFAAAKQWELLALFGVVRAAGRAATQLAAQE